MELGGINQEAKVAMPISVSYGAIHESSSKFKMQQQQLGGGGGNGALQQQGPSTDSGSGMPETAGLAAGLPPGLAAAKKAVRYRECLKNHAASIGGHAVDGCGEFMPSGEEGTLEALKCAACGCHRNFHRREVDGEATASCGYCLLSPRGGGLKKRFTPALAALPPPPHAAPLALPPTSPAGRVGPPPVIGGGGPPSGPLSPSDGDEPPMDHHHHHHPHHHQPHHPHHPHLPQQQQHHHPPFGMMMDGSMAYHHHHHLAAAAAAAAAAAGMAPSSSSVKKRFRTKFTPEQKDKMCAFAEKLGWRIQKHDEAAVQQFCSDVGVKRHVLKVWMHNNKNTVGKKMSSASDIGVGYLDNGEEASPTTSSGINA